MLDPYVSWTGFKVIDLAVSYNICQNIWNSELKFDINYHYLKLYKHFTFISFLPILPMVFSPKYSLKYIKII